MMKHPLNNVNDAHDIDELDDGYELCDDCNAECPQNIVTLCSDGKYRCDFCIQLWESNDE